MPHRIFEIDELARLISRHLVSTDPGSVASLACTCRFLEEPALSSLWELQDSLFTLIDVSPTHETNEEVRDQTVLAPIRPSRRCWVTKHNNSGNAWRRFRRYATWMRRLLLRDDEDDPWMTDNVFNHLLTGSTDGLVCPNLRSLTCHLSTANARFIPHFLSPHLTHLDVGVQMSNVMQEPPPDLLSTIRALPTPCLQVVSVDLGVDEMDHLKDEVTSMVQRCGHSLRVLRVPAPLREAAVYHVMGLENLQVWEQVHSPPPAVLPLSTAFPPLQSLSLNTKAAYGWIPWLAQRERGISDARDRPVEDGRLKATLTRLGFRDPIPINTTFISSLLFFPNLVTLHTQRSSCVDGVDCIFSLVDQDVVRLSAALPLLELLELGNPCRRNTCRTTISCLLALSVHCKRLRTLRIHINTSNLINDVQSMSEDPNFRGLGSLPTRCSLRWFHVRDLPFPRGTSDRDITTIAMGFVYIFPSLVGVHWCNDPGWEQLASRARKLRGPQASPQPEPQV